MVGKIIWWIVSYGCAILFFAIGVYALKRKKPMWFWSGSTVDEKSISDIPAYNRANGIMWICYSAVFWISAILGIFRQETAGVVLAVGCLLGIPALIIAYRKIYNKYKK